MLKLSNAQRLKLNAFAKQNYQRVPREIYNQCITKEDFAAVSNCLAVLPFYTLCGDRPEKAADKLVKQWNKKIKELEDLLKNGITMGEGDTLRRQLSEIKTPDFRYSTKASSRTQYKKTCEKELSNLSYTIGRERFNIIKAFLMEQYDIRYLSQNK